MIMASQEQVIFADYQKTYGSVNETKCGSPTPLKSLVYSTLAQLWACFGKYVCMINVGLIGSFPVLALPFLTSHTFKIHLSQNETEWMVSIIYITMAVGSVISALPFSSNRKVPMMVAQAVMTVSWIITYFATEPWELIAARALAGISMTLSLPQVQAYIGEVTVPQMRGTFGNLTQTMTIMGQFLMSALSYLHNWDQAVLTACCFPVLSIIYLYFIPESPIVLMKNKKYDEAWLALRKLRGWKWANEPEVIKEYRQIYKYCDMYKCKATENKNITSLRSNSSVSTFDSVQESDLGSVGEPYKHSQSVFPNMSDSRATLTGILLGLDNPSFVENEYDREIEINCNTNHYLELDGALGSQGTLIEIDLNSNKQLSKNILSKWQYCSNKKDTEIAGTNYKTISENSMLYYLLKPEMYKPTLLMLFCSFFVVGPGADSILIYLSLHIQDFHTIVDYNSLVSLLTAATLLGNILSVCCVSKIGKRIIILLSTVCAGLGYGSLCLVYYFQSENSLLFSVILMWIFFMEEFGMRTIYHALMSEVFPLRGKKVGPMIIVLMLCLNGFTLMKNMPSIISSYGTIYIIMFDVVLNFIGAVFFYVYLFETEGKTLNEIGEKFKRKD